MFKSVCLLERWSTPCRCCSLALHFATLPESAADIACQKELKALIATGVAEDSLECTTFTPLNNKHGKWWQ